LAVSALPHLLLAWRAGHWTARLGTLKTVIATDWARASIFAGLALAWPRVAPGSELAVLFAASFVANLASALFNPAILSLPLDLGGSGALQQLTALIDACFSFGNILGPICAALLYPKIGLRGLFLLNGLSYALAAVLETGVDAAAPAAADGVREDSGSTAGMRRLLRNDPLLRLMLGAFLAVNLCSGPLFAFLPLFVKSAYGGTISSLAWLETSLGIGMAAGGVALSLVRLESRSGLKISWGTGLAAASYVAFSMTRTSWQGCACLAAMGFAVAANNIFILNVFQTRPAPADVPVVMSLVNLISTASLPVSMGVVGLLIGAVEVRRLALTCSVLCAAAAAFLISRRELRTL
jgi:predicted MFS family arabinose efflux permease